MTDLLEGPRSSSLCSPKEVVVDLVPRVLMALWPHSKVLTYLALSDLSVGIGAGIFKRISKTVPKAGNITPPKAYYSGSQCIETVDAILRKISDMFPPEQLTKAVNTRCLKFINSLMNVIGDSVLVMFLMTTDAYVDSDDEDMDKSSASKDLMVGTVVK